MSGRGPVQDFCADLRSLQQESRLSVTALAARIGCSRSQLYAVLGGTVARPPDWTDLVEPLVRACTGDDPRALARWRRRHGLLTLVHEEMSRLAGPPRRVRRPAQLPPDLRHFVGRDADLARLDEALAAGPARPTGPEAGTVPGGAAGRTGTARAGTAGPASTAVPAGAAGPAGTAARVVVVTGPAGTGKTALTLHWAHRARGAFPDGQLHVDLRGFSAEEPLRPEAVLASFLGALGCADADVPAGLDDRAGLFRSLVAGRRVLLHLDNAWSAEQVLPLLPGSATCATIVTSRDRLRALSALADAARVDLDGLSPADGLVLLRHLAGDVPDLDGEHAGPVLAACGGLPLAIRLAGRLLAEGEVTSLRELAAELRRPERLDVLDSGVGAAGLAAALSWSYRALPPDLRTAFLLLATGPVAQLDVPRAAALLDRPAPEVRTVLTRLTQLHLLDRRSGFHDLVRAYALRAGREELAEDARRDAAARLVDHLVATASACMDVLFPAERPRRPGTAGPAGAPVDEDGARSWLAANRADLVELTVGLAAAPADLAAASAAAGVLWRYLDHGGHFLDGLAVHTAVRDGARRAGDARTERGAARTLGIVLFRLGRLEDAAGALREALALHPEPGIERCSVLNTLGLVATAANRLPDAVAHHTEALALARAAGHDVALAGVLDNLALAHLTAGDADRAEQCAVEALAVVREQGLSWSEGKVLGRLAQVRTAQGRYAEALRTGADALAAGRAGGDRVGELWALTGTGVALLALGDPQGAGDRHRAALAIAREVGDRFAELTVQARLGDVCRAEGEPVLAAHQHAAVRSAARELGFAGLVEDLRPDRSVEGAVQDVRAQRHAGLDGDAEEEAGRAPADGPGHPAGQAALQG